MDKFIPALKYHFLTPFYDIIIKLLVPENRIRKQIINTYELNGKEFVLDFGCGTGTFIVMLKKTYPNLNVVGIDVDDKIIEIAKKKFKQNNLQIPAYKHLINIPNELDIIYSSWVFHHLTTHEKLNSFKEIHEKLKEKGTFILADWEKPHNFLMKIAFFILQVFDNFTTTSDHKNGKIQAILKEAGFKNIVIKRIIPTPLGSLYIWQMSK